MQMKPNSWIHTALRDKINFPSLLNIYILSAFLVEWWIISDFFQLYDFSVENTRLQLELWLFEVKSSCSFCL